MIRVLALSLLVSAPALACSLVPTHDTFAIDATVDDRVPPAEPAATYELNRGQGPRRSGCAATVSSCDDIGWLAIAVTPPDGEDPAEIGYRFDLVEGELPEDLALPADAVYLVSSDAFHFVWIDGATNDQELIDVVIAITAVDRAGNESAPVEVAVSDPGGSARSRGAAWGLLALAAMPALYRRRRAACAGSWRFGAKAKV